MSLKLEINSFFIAHFLYKNTFLWITDEITNIFVGKLLKKCENLLGNQFSRSPHKKMCNHFLAAFKFGFQSTKAVLQATFITTNLFHQTEAVFVCLRDVIH